MNEKNLILCSTRKRHAESAAKASFACRLIPAYIASLFMDFGKDKSMPRERGVKAQRISSDAETNRSRVGGLY